MKRKYKEGGNSPETMGNINYAQGKLNMFVNHVKDNTMKALMEEESQNIHNQFMQTGGSNYNPNANNQEAYSNTIARGNNQRGIDKNNFYNSVGYLALGATPHYDVSYTDNQTQDKNILPQGKYSNNTIQPNPQPYTPMVDQDFTNFAQNLDYTNLPKQQYGGQGHNPFYTADFHGSPYKGNIDPKTIKSIHTTGTSRATGLRKFFGSKPNEWDFDTTITFKDPVTGQPVAAGTPGAIPVKPTVDDSFAKFNQAEIDKITAGLNRTYPNPNSPNNPNVINPAFNRNQTPFLNTPLSQMLSKNVLSNAINAIPSQKIQSFSTGDNNLPPYQIGGEPDGTEVSGLNMTGAFGAHSSYAFGTAPGTEGEMNPAADYNAANPGIVTDPNQSVNDVNFGTHVKRTTNYNPFDVANTIVAGTNMFSSFLEGRDRRGYEKKLKQLQNSDAVFNPMQGNENSRGDYDTNSGLFRPNANTPVQFSKFGGEKYAKGGEHELDEKEITRLRSLGYKVDYLD